jgi:hypothetical protein
VDDFIVDRRVWLQERDASTKLVQVPPLLFEKAADLVRADLASLNTVYGQLDRGIEVPSRSFADALQHAFPQANPARRIYESLPSVGELRALELQVASLTFDATTLRLQTILVSIAVGMGVNIDTGGRMDGMSAALVAPFLAAIPPLTLSDKSRLLERIDHFSMPAIDVDIEAMRRRLHNIVSLHALLGVVREAHLNPIDLPRA